jgi:actin-related protein
MKCEADVRLGLLRNVVMAGGTSVMEGFKERLKKELAATCSSLI